MNTIISKEAKRLEMDDKQRKIAFHFLKWFGDKIRNIFQPEEVEVTFTGEGKNVTYTYTKVSQKQVA